MIVEYIRYDLVTHRPEDLEAAYSIGCDALRSAPECRSFELARCEEAPTSLILRIEWESSAAHLQGFRKGPHFPPFLAAIKPFIGEIAEMRHYELTQVAWRRS